MKASHSTELAAATAFSVRVAQPHEVAAFDAQLAGQHYLGVGRPVGDFLRQIVERDGHAVTLLVWGPNCYTLKNRDLWINWSASKRVAHLKLVDQNRRFLLLVAKGQSPIPLMQMTATRVTSLDTLMDAAYEAQANYGLRHPSTICRGGRPRRRYSPSANGTYRPSASRLKAHGP